MSDKITPREFNDDLRRALKKSKKFSDVDLDEVEKTFQGDLNESGAGWGITREEIEDRLKWLRKNKSKHKLDTEELDILEAEMGKLL